MEHSSTMELRKNISKNSRGQKVLDLSHKRLSKVPYGDSEISDVEVLDISSTQLAELSPSINELKNLTELNLSSNNLTKLPESIGKFINLSCLKVNYNRLSAIPNSIKGLMKLQELHLNANVLQELPDGVTHLEDLRVLLVKSNLLSALPTDIQRLKKLQVLDVSDNKLQELPDGIFGLKELEKLYAANNQVSVLPTKSVRLEKLQELVLRNNKLKELPEDITHLHDLRKLNVSNNKLSVLPRNVRSLRNLQRLNANNNKLKELPNDIVYLDELTKLKVNNNQISVLPTGIKHLKKLKVLYLSYNDLKELPDDIETLEDLDILKVCGNPLTFQGMRNLEELMNRRPRRLSIDISASIFQPVSQEERLKDHHDKRKIFEGKVKEERVSWNLKEVAACITFYPTDVSEPRQMVCSQWYLEFCSPPIKENESLVSNVIELSCRDGPSGRELDKEVDERVTVMLSHSAIDLKGRELVIKELVDPENNEWKELETRHFWNKSDLQDQNVPDWLFPFAQAEITHVSSFAVIWRLKSYTFYKPTSKSTKFTCKVPEFPLSVTIPWTSVPESEPFSVTLQVQEVRYRQRTAEEVIAGPILHISCSQEVDLTTPARIEIPLRLRDDEQLPDALCSSQNVRIFFLDCANESPEWTEITKQLKVPAVLKNGIITFEVNHFSKFWPWLVWLMETYASLKKQASCIFKGPTPQRAEFLAFLCDGGGPSSLLVLILCCCPWHLKEQVKKDISSSCIVLRQGDGDSLEPLCNDEDIFVNLVSLKPCDGGTGMENYHLKFLENKAFRRNDLHVSVQDAETIPKVEFFKREENGEKGEKVCTLSIVPTPQASKEVQHKEKEVQREKEMELSYECRTASTSREISDRTSAIDSNRRMLKVTLLADEWNSKKGGLSTMNRELAIHLAGLSDVKVQVTMLVLHSPCSDEEKREANSRNVTIVEVPKKTGMGNNDCLMFLTRDLTTEVVVGHGVTLGWQAMVIKHNHNVKWLQVVHTDPEDLSLNKTYENAITKGEEKMRTESYLCQRADLVMTVGTKLKGAYSSYLRSCGKEDNVHDFTPGIIEELTDLEPAANDTDEFKVLIIGRSDPEDFKVKGYDIAALAFTHHELKDKPFILVFVGASCDRMDEVADFFLKFGIPKKQLKVRKFITSRKDLKMLFREVDLVIMPSRTEGFGFVALEALSAGVPFLVSGNSGFAKALKDVTFATDLYVVFSEDPEVWAKRITAVQQRNRAQRLHEVKIVREYYKEQFSWEKDCSILVNKMWNMVHDRS